MEDFTSLDANEHDYATDPRLSDKRLTTALEVALMNTEMVHADELDDWFDNIRECIGDVTELAERTMKHVTNKSVLRACDCICEHPMDTNHIRELMLYYEDVRRGNTD